MKYGLYIGVMSGTSMDGIDAALVKFHAKGHTHIASYSHRWPHELQQQLRALASPGDDEIEKLGILDAQVADEFAQCILELLKEANISQEQVIAIGSHGQTIRHRPYVIPPFTLQIGDPNRIAELTGITTVADFRRRDMAAGGQGAPLVCAFHEASFRVADETRAILNIGGIANITLLPADHTAPVLGFDTGPGNTLLDAWSRRHLGMPYDEGGTWAAGGNTNQQLLKKMLRDDYLMQHPPKSTGPEHFNLSWLDSILAKIPPQEPHDIQATLLDFSVITIVQALQKEAPECQRVIACGGGAHNKMLMARLRQELAGIPVTTSGDYDINPNNVEAIAFAWLARQTLLGLPGNIPEVTGASSPRVLGGIYQATKY